MRVLIAPDKFKDALDAAGVAVALAAGVRDARPDGQVTVCPLADGGEGTGRLLAKARGATARNATVLDPLGRERVATWWLCPDATAAIIEMAEASGLALVEPAQRDALAATSFGTGQLILAACEASCRHIVLCVGGSASVDGGAGCLQALGWRLLTAADCAIDAPLSGGMLLEVSAIRPPAAPAEATVEVLCDVDHPLLGPRGAAAVFGPQKGASTEGVRRLERGLAHWAALLEQLMGPDIGAIAGGGAAGGLPAGLAATLGAVLRPGFDAVADAVGLRRKLADCDVCITAEGRIDDQTVGGKVVGGVARMASELGVPVIALAGAVRPRVGQTVDELARDLGLQRIVVVTPPGTPIATALAETSANLRRAAREVVQSTSA